MTVRRPAPAGGIASIRRAALVAIAFAFIFVWFPATSLVLANAAAAAAGNGSSAGWTVYHGDAVGSGVAQGVTSVATQSAAWTSPALDGQLFGQPVALGSEVFVATENNTVYALRAASGAVAWSAHVGTAVPASSLPCGDISPLVGITGTPVIDPARGEIFVVAGESTNGGMAHHLVGLNTANGKVLLDQVIDPTGASPAALLQRTALTLDAGRVVFGLGGNFGDCGSYHGWVLAVPEGGGTPATFEVDAGAGQSQGAIWMGGAAPAVDAQGNVWVTAGNGSVTSAGAAYDDSDSVLELSPSLSLLQFFAPTDWAADNRADRDLSIEPVLLTDGLVVAAGKARAASLLNASHLGGVGGQMAEQAAICNQDVVGGAAVVGTTVFLPCQSGPVAIQVTSTPPSLHVMWQAAVGGGPPVVAGGLVWTISQSGVLYALNPVNGSVQAQANIGTPANHFPTPGFGPGLLLAPGNERVVAFATATATAATSTTTTRGPVTTTTTHRHQQAAASSHRSGGSGLPGWAIALFVVAALVLIGAVVAAIRRRQGRGASSVR